MKALDILVAARKRLTNKTNWIIGSLYQSRAAADGGFCFCAVGAVLKEGGGMIQPRPNGLSEHYLTTVTSFLAGSAEKRSLSAGDVYDRLDRAASKIGSMFTDPDILKVDISSDISVIMAQASGLGFQVRPTITALKYLQAAAKTIDGSRGNVVACNDQSGNDANHQLVLKMYDVAIKNAKRRHINGGRKAQTGGVLAAQAMMASGVKGALFGGLTAKVSA